MCQKKSSPGALQSSARAGPGKNYGAPRKIRVRARRPCKVPWIWVLASPIFNLKNHQSKVLTLVKPEIPGSLIGPVQFLFKAGPYLDLAGPNLPIAEIHDQIWQ